MRILIVDDEYVSQIKLQTLLKDRGECDTASNGAEALECLKEAYEFGRPYGLVTMDISMPDMNGHEVIQELRTWESTHRDITEGREAKVLMITATKHPKDVLSSFSEGAEWYLVKPITPESLQEALKEINLIESDESGTTAAASASPVATPAREAPPTPATAPASGSETACPLGLEIPNPRSIFLGSMDADFLLDYMDSTRAKLPDLERDALDLETSKEVEALRNSIMRNLHSLKGEAGMIGLVDVQNICHETESIVKDCTEPSQCADLVLRVKDWMEAVLEFVSNPEAPEPEGTGPQPQAPSSAATESAPASSPTIAMDLPDPATVDSSAVVADFWNDYARTSSEKLNDLESLALKIEGGEASDSDFDKAMGLCNFLKGEGSMIGLPVVQQVYQKVEGLCRAKGVTPETGELLLRSIDWMRALVESISGRPLSTR